MADIFISYSRAVRAPTLELAGRLWAEGYTTWTDTNLGADGEPFQQIIDAEVDAAKAVVVIWSPPALHSRWVNYESSRGQRQNKLFCTHTSDVDPTAFPADFHGLNSLGVSDFTSLHNSLINRKVLPEGKTEADLPPEQVLERHALHEWRDKIEQSENIEEVRAYVQKFERARMVRDVARWKLANMEARELARGNAQREGVFKMFEAIRDSNDPDVFDFFLKKYLGGFPEMGALAALRLKELDPERFVKAAEQLGNAAALKELVLGAERAIRLRNTPPESAMLRLDPGMHTAAIKRIAVTADGKLMATASHDKTVKLWSLPDGALLRTLRPSIGRDDQGKVYSVAMDPAGKWVAVGGWMSGGLYEEHVFIFDAESGHVLKQLGPLPNVVNDLEVSTDGARLAAGLGEKGVRVWDTRTWKLLFEDQDYTDTVYGLAFAKDGRLATSSYDGKIRLYGPDGRRRARVALPGNDQPFGIAFANGKRATFGPGDDKIAVGHSGAVGVDLLDGRDLKLLGKADTAALASGHLSSVAFFGPNGSRLVAGGFQGGKPPMFVWEEFGRGARSAWSGADNTVMDLAALPDNALAFGAFDPAFGVIEPDGKPRLLRGPETADLRNALRQWFTVSPDAGRVRVGLKAGNVQVLFDVAKRSLTDSPEALPDLVPAETTTLPVKNWEDNGGPTFDGRPMRLISHESARCVAIAPDAKSFVLGADWSLRRYDDRGQQLWEQAVPGTAWGVNLAREGKVVVTAYADGTIRWLRAEDGSELLALFIHLPKGPEGPREWILFTPEGYYDASSSSAETLIGWHVNRGADQAADFYPVETFATTFKRPEKIDAAFDGL